MTSKARDTADIVDDVSVELASKLDLAGGKILQIVRATDATNRSTTSTSYVDVTGMSVTITPQKSDSAILIVLTARIAVFGTNVTQNAGIRITDASNNGISGGDESVMGNTELSGTTKTVRHNFISIAYATPATTSATTYKVRTTAGAVNTTVEFQNATQVGQLYAIEVSA